MSRRLALLVSVALLAACSHAPPAANRGALGPTRGGGGSPIAASELRRDVFAFAADSFRGRETGTPDAQRAAAFLARRVQQLGLEPAGDSMYMQRVPLVRETLTRGTRLAVTMNGKTRLLRLGADVAPVTSFDDELPDPKRNADGDMMFLGYGPTSEDDLQALSRMNLEGKVLVVLHGTPGSAMPTGAAAKESMQSLGTKLGLLFHLHPSAVVFLMSGGMERFYRGMAPELLRGVSAVGKEEAVSEAARVMPMVLFGIAHAGSPLLPAGWPNDVRTQDLGRHFTGHIEVQRDAFTGYNVVAVVRGRDARLNKTYLAYGAHYDHIGILRRDEMGDRANAADSIANGADDDGSGSVALLAIARQMQANRPRRSVLFVWHVAEEKGMLGSAYFTEHPTVPIDSIIAQFNADMIGRNEPNTLALVGPRAAPNYLSWRLGMIVDSVNRAYPTPFRIDRQYDDAENPERIYQRSDHYNYAKKGIPIVFFTTGMHEDYHEVSDEASRLDYDKMARVARLMLDAGYAVANRTSRPISTGMVEAVSSQQR